MPIIAAPSQTFGVSIIVVDTNGKGYSFSAGGQVPSAPQSGSTYTWDQTTKSAAIAANWRAIAARNDATGAYHNQASISDIIGQIGAALVKAAQDVAIVAGAITAVVVLLGGGGKKGSGNPPDGGRAAEPPS